MRTHHILLHASLLAGFALLALPLSAAELPEAASLPLLKLSPEAGAAAKLEVLREVIPLAKGTQDKVEEAKDRLRLNGATWRLDVLGDGSAAEFIDSDVYARSHNNGVQPAQAMTRAALEAMGRKFIDDKLSKVISLHEGEQLAVAATSQRTEGGVEANGNNPYSAVVANRVIFTREINGVPVVGAGSKVTVTFLNNGELESFRYDWPNYAASGENRKIATAAEVLRRVQQVSGVRTNTKLDGPLAATDLKDLNGPLKLGDKVELEDLTCGYYDPGIAVRDASAPIQPGCYYHVIQTEGEGDFVSRTGYSGAVPSATVYDPDSRWPEVNVLNGIEVVAPQGGMAGPSDKMEPVAPRPKTGN